MKIPITVTEQIHIVDEPTDVWDVISQIATSGTQEDPFFVCDIGDIVRKFHNWTTKMPRVQPYYAVKCNDTPIVLEVLAALGCNFDCASKGEINKVLDLGVDSSKIIFAHPCKPQSHIRHAQAVGVELMTFDNETELHKIKCLYPTAKLVLRIRYDDISAKCLLGVKFGCDPINEAPRLLEVARSLDLNVVGISFHVGSGSSDATVFRDAIGTARTLFDYAAGIGFHFNLLDIGGGYPGSKSSSIDKIASIVNQAVAEWFPDPSIHIIAEPGRYMCASAFTLATCIHSKRTVINPNGVHEMYYINDGVYGNFNAILYDHFIPNPTPLKASCGPLEACSIWGPTCDGLDLVCDNVLLPKMHIGDWIIFEDMGAYTLPVASPFNGFPLPKVHVIVSDAIWEILKQNFVFPDEDILSKSMQCGELMQEDQNIYPFPLSVIN